MKLFSHTPLIALLLSTSFDMVFGSVVVRAGNETASSVDYKLGNLMYRRGGEDNNNNNNRNEGEYDHRGNGEGRNNGNGDRNGRNGDRNGDRNRKGKGMGKGMGMGNGMGNGNGNGHGNGHGNGYEHGNGEGERHRNGYENENGNGEGGRNRNDYGNGGENGGEGGRYENGYVNENGGEGRYGFQNGNYGGFYYGNEGNEVQGLNGLLGLERLKLSFYEHGLKRYNEEEWRRAGFPEWVHGRYCQILEHAREHVRFLEEAIQGSGSERVKECHYRFNHENPWRFAEQSEVLETVVGAAFIGRIHNQHDHKEYTTAEASILAVDERHAAWIGSAVLGRNPWNTAFETPLTINQAYSALAEFLNIETCPESNHSLLPSNHRIFPTLRIPPRPIPGTEVEIFIEGDSFRNEKFCYAAFLAGRFVYFVRIINRDGRYFVFIPRELRAKGIVYVIIIRGTSERVEDVRISDQDTLAGPGVINFPFNSRGEPIYWNDEEREKKNHHEYD